MAEVGIEFHPSHPGMKFRGTHSEQTRASLEDILLKTFPKLTTRRAFVIAFYL